MIKLKMFKPFIGILIFLLAQSHGADPFTEAIPSPEIKLQNKLAELEASVASSMVREIDFREERTFPFRRKPIELTGIVRLWKERGISIEYPEDKTILILDDLGVLMRKIADDGSFKERSSGLGDGAMASLLKAALGFDKAELEQLFFLTWYEDAEEWSIVMTPRIEQENTIEQVTMSGQALLISKIELGFSGRKKITIIPKDEQINDGFSLEEQKKYFRSSIVEGK